MTRELQGRVHYDELSKAELIAALSERDARIRSLETQLAHLSGEPAPTGEPEGALAVQVRQTQKLESLGVLAGGIAHDFNNLLCGILGGVELAMDELEPEHEARVDLEMVQKSARDAMELCRQLLAYSGKGRFVVEPVDVSRLIEAMLPLLRISAGKSIAIRLQLGTELPSVQADQLQLRQVLVNLLVNAAEAISGASGTITIATGVMDCDPEYLRGTYFDDELPGGRYVFIEVADSGVGMDAATMQRLFDPFYSTKFTGRGLGLAAVQGIVRGHRGAVKVYTEPKTGSTFKILLPASDEAVTENGLPPTRPGWRGSGLVLLADDEPSVRAVGKRILERLGFEVVLAEDGAQALEVFDRVGHQIVLVVLDMTMPNLGGEETFRELRRRRPDVRVVLTSGYNEQEATSRFAGKGLAAFVGKPFQLDTVRATLQRVFRSP